MSSSLQTKLLVSGVVCAAAVLLEFGAFRIDRGLGDYVYLAVSSLLAGLSVWLASSMTSRVWGIVAVPVLSLMLLAGNSYYAAFIRNELLRLGEGFGQSAIAGIVVFLVILPLTVLATVATAIIQSMLLRRS